MARTPLRRATTSLQHHCRLSTARVQTGSTAATGPVTGPATEAAHQVGTGARPTLALSMALHLLALALTVGPAAATCRLHRQARATGAEICHQEEDRLATAAVTGAWIHAA